MMRTPRAPHALPAERLAAIDTPAFVFDATTACIAVEQLAAVARCADLKVLFSIKACALMPLLKLVAERVDGFSVSSWFESRLARSVLDDKGTVHLTSPGLDKREVAAAQECCNAISFNSLGQWQRMRAGLATGVQAGLRVNPERSLVADERYDPCRPHSKLGVPLAALRAAVAGGVLPLNRLDGLHFHTHCESTSYRPLIETLALLEEALPTVFKAIRWLNMGGGYRADAADAGALAEQVQALRRRYGFDVYMEPGKGIVGAAGSLLASVVDVFDSGGKTIAVLDTSVNHQPEVFEYGRVPPVSEEDPGGPYRYLLAGGTCLAGDLFGEYTFAEPLAVGSRITFTDVGAYSLAKAHRFNGHNLPDVYLHGADGMLQRVVHPDFEDYARLWGGR
jgi:carboxynorspermidine decarboxylase